MKTYSMPSHTKKPPTKLSPNCTKISVERAHYNPRNISLWPGPVRRLIQRTEGPYCSVPGVRELMLGMRQYSEHLDCDLADYKCRRHNSVGHVQVFQLQQVGADISGVLRLCDYQQRYCG